MRFCVSSRCSNATMPWAAESGKLMKNMGSCATIPYKKPFICSLKYPGRSGKPRLANQLHNLNAMRYFFNDLIDARMQPEDLIQLACLLAISPPKINRHTQRRQSNYLHEYLTASHDRLDRWNFYLPNFNNRVQGTRRSQKWAEHEENASKASAQAHSTSTLALITEMILSEPLSRVWAAILAKPQKWSTDTDPVDATAPFRDAASDILKKHCKLIKCTMESLERCLPEKNSRDLMQTIYRRTLRWTDLLLAHMEQFQPASCFASNPRRCLDFAEDLRWQWKQNNGPQTAALTITSVRQAICEPTSAVAFSARLNYRIGASVLQSCDSGDLESLGLANPRNVVRRWATFARCESMLGAALEDGSKSESSIG